VRARFLSGFAEEVFDSLRQFELRRAAWSASRVLPAFTFPRTRARLLSVIGCDIGSGTGVTGYVRLVGPPGCASRLRIGSGCLLGPDVTLCLDASITLGQNVSLGPRAVLYTATHPLGDASRRMQFFTMARPIVVEDGAWIGLGALILAGVTVGRGAVVSAGAVVTKDVPENALVAGNPATVVQALGSR
jgi:maltose O-acetyltransferase